MYQNLLCKISFGCVLLLAVGCTKDETRPISPNQRRPYWGSVSAKRNGVNWKANIYAGYHPLANSTERFGFTCDVYAKLDNDSVMREAFRVLNIEKRSYLSDLDSAVYDTTRAYHYANQTTFATYHRFYDDGDVISMSYLIAENQPHWVQIDSFNEFTKETSGTFSITFISRDQPDTVRFTDGHFQTRVQVP